MSKQADNTYLASLYGGAAEQRFFTTDTIDSAKILDGEADTRYEYCDIYDSRGTWMTSAYRNPIGKAEMMPDTYIESFNGSTTRKLGNAMYAEIFTALAGECRTYIKGGYYEYKPYNVDKLDGTIRKSLHDKTPPKYVLLLDEISIIEKSDDNFLFRRVEGSKLLRVSYTNSDGDISIHRMFGSELGKFRGYF